MNPYTYTCSADQARQVLDWLCTRGGIAIWSSVDLCDPNASWTTPYQAHDGTPTTKPTWKAADAPKIIITDPAQVGVYREREVRRFHVAVRMGDSGMRTKLTTASGRKLHAALERAGEQAFYRFDYSTQEAVILVPEGTKPLLEWAGEQAGERAGAQAVRPPR